MKGMRHQPVFGPHLRLTASSLIGVPIVRDGTKLIHDDSSRRLITRRKSPRRRYWRLLLPTECGEIWRQSGPLTRPPPSATLSPQRGKTRLRRGAASDHAPARGQSGNHSAMAEACAAFQHCLPGSLRRRGMGVSLVYLHAWVPATNFPRYFQETINTELRHYAARVSAQGVSARVPSVLGRAFCPLQDAFHEAK